MFEKSTLKLIILHLLFFPVGVHFFLCGDGEFVRQVMNKWRRAAGKGINNVAPGLYSPRSEKFGWTRQIDKKKFHNTVENYVY